MTKILTLSLIALCPLACDSTAATTLFKQTFDQSLTYCTPGTSCTDGWIINSQNGKQYFGSPCDPSNIACTQETSDGTDKFLRLTIANDPSTTVGYDNAEYAGTQTGYSFNQGQYCLTSGQTQVFYQSARLGPTYNIDGTGGAVGTAGLGPWNSYPDPNAPGGHPANAVWWQWSEKSSLLGMYDGLAVAVVYQNNFNYFKRFPAEVDVHNWWKLAITRHGNSDGTENWSFSLSQSNQTYDLGSASSPSMGCLTYETWNDNQFVTFDTQTNQIIRTFHTPATNQTWDLKSLQIDQQ